ncbi:MAG: multiheme c-type cytochrome [Nannocystaceae bacterium]
MFGIPWAGALALLGVAAAPELATDAACVACHPTVAAEWWSSQHRSAFTEPTFQEAHALEPHAFCRGCHAPQQDPAIDQVTPAAIVGVGCLSCHVADGVILAGEGTAGTSASPHPLRRDPGLGAAACGRCHQFAFPDDGLRERPLLMQATIDEHAASRRSDRSCAACHMPKGADGRRSHAFAASRDPAALRRALRVEADRVDARRIRVTLRAGEVGHAVPTGDLLRRLEVGAALPGRAAQSSRRYLARHFGQRRQASGIVVRDELGDDRVPGDGRPREVLLEVDGAEGEAIDWWVRYQRVSHRRRLDPAGDAIAGMIEVAAGQLPP